MKKYDFILFEHTTVINHQHDLEEIAKLLQCQGKRVAIAEVYNERIYCKDSTIEHYTFKTPFTDRFLTVDDCRFTPLRFFINRIKLRRYYKFLRVALAELSGVSSNIYCGSFFNVNSYNWLKRVPKDVNLFLWGLRSFWLYEYKIRPFTLFGVYSFFNRNLLSRNTNIRLFVSNEIIRDEYVALGIAPERLIIRPERTINELVKSSFSEDGRLRLLTIGSLRPDKRIEMTAEALRIINDDDISFVIAGSTSSDPFYEKNIMQATSGLRNVIRMNSRLNDKEYQSIFDECDFLVLCDKQHASSVTNGTMNEALLKGKPIIAPNYNPYKYIIDNFGVGISFDDGSIDSLVKAIQSAKAKGASFFSDAIECYQKTLLVDKVSEKFICDLRKSNISI